MTEKNEDAIRTIATHKLQLFYRHRNAAKASCIDLEKAQILYNIPHRNQHLKIIKSTPDLLCVHSHIISKFALEIRNPANFLNYYGYRRSVYETSTVYSVTHWTKDALGIGDDPETAEHYFITDASGAILGLFEFCPRDEYRFDNLSPVREGGVPPERSKIYSHNAKFFGIYLFEHARKQSIGRSVLQFLLTVDAPIRSLVSAKNQASRALHDSLGYEACALVISPPEGKHEDLYVYQAPSSVKLKR